MLISLTVGKVDAGVAVLLTEDKRLIEFPSILLPPDITSGSIVDITVARNHTSEALASKAFKSLQSSILQTYGLSSPSPPVLRCRNATQTSVVLEWDKLDLATANLKSLSLYRNGSKAGVIPRAAQSGQEVQATKVSGLAVDTEYTFHLVLKTSAGMYQSEKLTVKTHKMTDLSGITVTPGILPPPLRESLNGAVERIGAKVVEGVRIDTTHFVCTEGRGRDWERAFEMNIPVVRPEWVEGCEREGRIVGVRGYYLNADPKLRQVGQGVGMQQQQSQRPQQRERAESQATIPPQVQDSQENVAQEPPQAQPQTASSTVTLPHRPASPKNGSDVNTPPPPLPAKDEPQQHDQDPPSAEESHEESELGEGSGVVSPEEEPVGLGLQDKGDEKEEEAKTPGIGSFSDVQL